MDTRKCTDCRQVFPLTFEHFRHAKTPRFRGFAYKCRPCMNAYTGKYRKATGFYQSNTFLAREAIKQALKTGTIVKKSCASCKNTITQAHHHRGYAKTRWLDVVWLCQEHHLLAHGKKYTTN